MRSPTSSALGAKVGASVGAARLVGALVRDDLEERHDLRRREVVHADDVLRALGLCGDVANREGGGVGRDDGVIRADRLHLLNDRVLDAKLLEDGLKTVERSAQARCTGR